MPCTNGQLIELKCTRWTDSFLPCVKPCVKKKEDDDDDDGGDGDGHGDQDDA